MNIFSIVIAGVDIEVHSPLTLDEMGLAERLGPFTTPSSPPIIKSTVRWQDGKPGEVPLGDLLFDPGDIWRMYHNRADDTFSARVLYSNDDEMLEGAVCRTDRAWENITLTERPDGPDWQSFLALGVGELIFRSRILFADGMVFHASGLDDNGRAIVFVGHAGAGKSTQASWWLNEPGVVGLNDDRVAVRLVDDGAVAYGTPWGGTANIAHNREAPLAALVVLEQAPENTITPLSKAEAAQQLLPRSYLPFWDAALVQRTTDCLSQLLDRVPVFRLRSRREPEGVSLVRSVL